MKTMMPYKYNYPLYLDVNDYNKQAKFNPMVDHHHDGNRQFLNQHNLIYQREETSPTSSLMNLNAFYDSVLSSGHQAFAFLNGKSHVASLPFHQYFNSKHFQNKRIITEDENKIKSSFSIDSILGINAHHSRNKYLLVNESDLNCMKPKDEIELNYSKTNNVSSVSPDSTAKEQNIVVKHNVKGKALFTNSSGNNNSQKRNINCVDEEELLNSAAKYSKSSLKTETHQSHNSNSANNQAGKSKRVRTIFTPEQLERLESEFERQQYMVGHERLYLASALNLTEAQVKVWFQNRRIKHRKQYFEKEHAMIAELRNRSEDSKDNTTTTATDENDGNIHDDESIGTLSPINHNEYNQHTDSSVSCSLLSQK